MTEQQAQSPIDDLFRNAFENLPDTPAESGWDTPSNQVWQQVESNIRAPQKTWSLKSMLVAAGGFAVALIAIALFWTNSGSKEPQTVPGTTTQPNIEQPVVSPATSTNQAAGAAETAPKESTGTKVKSNTEQPSKQITTPTPAGNSSNNAAQPLPGSKISLPPNTTEANKHKQQ